MAAFVQLNDPDSQRHRLVCWDHVSVIEVSREDGTVTLRLLGGHELRLTPTESRQLIDYARAHRAEIEIG